MLINKSVRTMLNQRKRTQLACISRIKNSITDREDIGDLWYDHTSQVNVSQYWI
jgi:hypothetical protein